MKGIVFNLLEEAVRHEYGEDAWDTLLETAKVAGAYTSLGSYGDDELMALVAAAAELLNTDPSDVVRWFGRQAIPLLAERYPDFFTAHTSTRSFLLTLNDIIHPEVKKLYPGADVPDFTFDTSHEGVLVMEYSSHRKLCALADGMIEGAATHYGDSLALEHSSCMLRGDDKCVFRIALEKKALAA